MAFEEHVGGSRAARLAQQGPGGAASRGRHTKGSGTEPLGVEPGHTVRRDYYDKLASQAASRDPNPALRGPQYFTARTSPTYYAGAEVEEFATKDPAYVSRVQRSLEMAGLLDNYRKGFWDKPSISAMKEAMSYANQRGIGWEQAVAELIDSPLEGSAARRRQRIPYQLKEAFVKPAYSPPDYEAMKVKVQNDFKELLNRDPEPYELLLFANELQADYRKQYDVAVDAARRNFEAKQRMVESGHGFDPNAEGLHVARAQDAGTTEAEVDPEARHMARLRERLGPTMDAIRTEDEQRQIMGAVLGSMGALGDII